jgi:hypothetical protein
MQHGLAIAIIFIFIIIDIIILTYFCIKSNIFVEIYKKKVKAVKTIKKVLYRLSVQIINYDYIKHFPFSIFH